MAQGVREAIRSTVLECFEDALQARHLTARCALTDSTVLLESGLDSLGFAILVVKLEDELGYDPFVLMDEPVYPRTLAELLAIYEKFRE
jgi:acyl carrier protein